MKEKTLNLLFYLKRGTQSKDGKSAEAVSVNAELGMILRLVAKPFMNY